MFALLVTVGACLLDNGRLPKVLASAEYRRESLPSGNYTLSGSPNYFVLYSLYSEEETIFTVNDRDSNPTHIYEVALRDSDEPVNVSFDVAVTAVSIRIRLPVQCHEIAMLGLRDVPESFYYRLSGGSSDGVLCFLTVTYSEDERVTVSVKAKGPETYAQAANLTGKVVSECSESKCEFKDLRLGNVVTAIMSRFGSELEVKKDGSKKHATNDPCFRSFGYRAETWSLSPAETAFGNSVFFTTSSYTCHWQPWWLIFIYVAAVVIVVGAVVGGIMCCYCGVCTCCGCCTCWVKKEEGEMVDA